MIIATGNGKRSDTCRFLYINHIYPFFDTYTLEALRLSAVDYLLKPMDNDELETAIQRLQKKVSE